MTTIFISYAHEDSAVATRIVAALAREGLEAWSDHAIPPGHSWDDVIGQRINAARVVIVIWSRHSVVSNFVKEEAQLAFEAGKLLPLKVDEVEPPVGFRRVQAANLRGWGGEAQHQQWRVVLNELRSRVGIDPVPVRPARSERASPPASGAPRALAPLIAGGIGLSALGIAIFVAISVLRDASEPPAQVVEEPVRTIDIAAEQVEEPPDSIDVAAERPSTRLPARVTTAAPVVDARSVELEYWRSCCNGRTVGESDYRGYLDRYPGGEFSAIARQRLQPIESPTLANSEWEGSNTLDASSSDNCAGGPGATLQITMVFRPDGTASTGIFSGTYRLSGDQVEVISGNGGRIVAAISGRELSGTFTYHGADYRCFGTVRARRSN